MKVLAIDTSGPSMSVALAERGRVLCEEFIRIGMNHSEKLIPSIGKALKRAGWGIGDVKKIAVTTGPGSFTGVRIGLACARITAQVLGLPLVGIDSIRVLEAGAEKKKCRVCAAIDAQRGEVFVRSGSKNNAVEIRKLDEYISDIAGSGEKPLLIGSGALNHRAFIEKTAGNKVKLLPGRLNFPRASVLAALATNEKGVKYSSVKPLYVRRSWAEEKKK